MPDMKKRPELLDSETLYRAAECLKVMSHPTRLRIVDILMQGEYAVGEIAEMCELPPNQTSEHLRLMKGHGLLESRREARKVFYRIISPNLPGLLTCIKTNCGQVALKYIQTDSTEKR